MANGSVHMIGRIIAALRAFLRRHPRLERQILALIAPIIPRLIPVINRLRGPDCEAWFARYQASTPEDDAAILRALANSSPAFLVVVAPGALGAATRASLRDQIAISWRAVEAPDAAAALAVFKGGFVMLLDQGETLERHALAAFAIAARRNPSARVLYADEDLRDASGKRCAPWFKAAFDRLRLLQQASLGSAIAFDAALVREHGLLELRGHSLALAATNAAGEDAVHHVPSVLLHRSPDSAKAPWRTATDPQAVRSILAQDKLGARLSERTERPLHITWPLPAPAPLVSIIIPTRDRANLLGPVSAP